jgi:glycosyltransferase involved in cell wall biosynthesis
MQYNKNDHEYLLCIAVPSYNRAKELDRLISSIVSQKQFTNKICVVIADWPSTDNTKQIVKWYQKKYKNIFLFENNENIWMNKALLEVISLSKWEYTWLVWSDDQLSDFSLEQMIKVIENQKPWLLLSNVFWYKEKKDILNCSKEESYTVVDWFSELANYMWSHKYHKNKFIPEQHFTFMSVFCFDTNLFNKWLQLVIKEKWTQYIEKHYFNYMFAIYRIIWNSKIVHFNSDFILLNFHNNVMWNANMKIYSDLVDLCNMINENYFLNKNFLLFTDKIKKDIHSAMRRSKRFVRITQVLKTIWLYNSASYLRKKYILKMI